MSLTCQMTVGGNATTTKDGAHIVTPLRRCGRVAVAMTAPNLTLEEPFPVCKVHRVNLDKRAAKIGRPNCVPL